MERRQLLMTNKVGTEMVQSLHAGSETFIGALTTRSGPVTVSYAIMQSLGASYGVTIYYNVSKVLGDSGSDRACFLMQLVNDSTVTVSKLAFC